MTMILWGVLQTGDRGQGTGEAHYYDWRHSPTAQQPNSPTVQQPDSLTHPCEAVGLLDNPTKQE